MAIQFTNQAQELTYRKVADYFASSTLFKDTTKPDNTLPKFSILYGSALIEVEILAWDVHPWENRELAIVKAYSCVTIGSSVDAELMQYLLRENRQIRFGAFHLDEANQIWFANSILGGESMDLMELQTCILAVVTIADTYDDLISEKYGGHRYQT
jgi:hypothetical protein